MLLEAGCEVRGDEPTARGRCAREDAQPNRIGTPNIWMRSSRCAWSTTSTAAIAHIRRYGSQHTDCIVDRRCRGGGAVPDRVDSAIVLHNASTQFADGGEFGMGAEIGISTDKFHARGPVGVEQLTSYKYLVRGSGQIRG